MAKESGFEVTAPMDPRKLKFLPAVRDMCAANTCRQYGKKWVCPPACGAIDEMEGRYHRFRDGVIFQTICRMDDEYDLESMYGVMENHKNAMRQLLETLSGLDEEVVPFGSDGCGRCTECTYPEAPCRFPESAFPSLEACGLLVSDVCKDNDVPYYYGRNTVAYTGAFLFNPEARV
jgi:predicted metal-binding protein